MKTYELKLTRHMMEILRHQDPALFSELCAHDETPNAAEAAFVWYNAEILRAAVTAFSAVVNDRAAFANTDGKQISAMAAIKRIRKALGLKGTLEGTALKARKP